MQANQLMRMWIRNRGWQKKNGRSDDSGLLLSLQRHLTSKPSSSVSIELAPLSFACFLLNRQLMTTNQSDNKRLAKWKQKHMEMSIDMDWDALTVGDTGPLLARMGDSCTFVIVIAG